MVIGRRVAASELRRAPTQIAYRRRGKWNAAIDCQPIFDRALNQPVFDFDGRRLLREAATRGTRGDEQD